MKSFMISMAVWLAAMAPAAQAAEQTKKTKLLPSDGVTWQHGLSQGEEAAADKKDISPSWQHGLSNWDAPAKPVAPAVAAAAAPSTPPAAPVAVQKSPLQPKPRESPRHALRSLEQDKSGTAAAAPPAAPVVPKAATNAASPSAQAAPPAATQEKR